MNDIAGPAVVRFVNAFVIAAKRERMLTMVLHKDRNKRKEAIQTVYKWIDAKRQVELARNSGFPRQLTERFGDLTGVLLDESTARHVTIGEAAALASVGLGAIFIADTKLMAVLFPEVGPPTLCSGTE